MRARRLLIGIVERDPQLPPLLLFPPPLHSVLFRLMRGECGPDPADAQRCLGAELAVAGQSASMRFACPSGSSPTSIASSPVQRSGDIELKKRIPLRARFGTESDLDLARCCFLRVDAGRFNDRHHPLCRWWAQIVTV